MFKFRIRGYHPLCRSFPAASPTQTFCNSVTGLQPGLLILQPLTSNARRLALERFGLVPVRSPLLGESRLISVPTGTKMVQFPAFAYRYSGMTRCGFPHSEILGSALACQLAEAYRRLLRPSSLPDAKASTVCPFLLDPFLLIRPDAHPFARGAPDRRLPPFRYSHCKRRDCTWVSPQTVFQRLIAASSGF